MEEEWYYLNLFAMIVWNTPNRIFFGKYFGYSSLRAQHLHKKITLLAKDVFIRKYTLDVN